MNSQFCVHRRPNRGFSQNITLKVNWFSFSSIENFIHIHDLTSNIA